MPLQSFHFNEIGALEALTILFKNNKAQLAEAYQLCFGKLLVSSKHPINLLLLGRYSKLTDYQLVRLVNWLETKSEPFSLDFTWPRAGSMMHAVSDNINEQFLAIQASLNRGKSQHNTDFVSYKYKYNAYGYLRRHNNTYTFSLREFDPISEEMRGYYTVNNVAPKVSSIRKK